MRELVRVGLSPTDNCEDVFFRNFFGPTTARIDRSSAFRSQRIVFSALYEIDKTDWIIIMRSTAIISTHFRQLFDRDDFEKPGSKQLEFVRGICRSSDTTLGSRQPEEPMRIGRLAYTRNRERSW